MMLISEIEEKVIIIWIWMQNEESLLNRGLSFILLKDIHSINRTNLQKNGVKKIIL